MISPRPPPSNTSRAMDEATVRDQRSQLPEALFRRHKPHGSISEATFRLKKPSTNLIDDLTEICRPVDLATLSRILTVRDESGMRLEDAKARWAADGASRVSWRGQVLLEFPGCLVGAGAGFVGTGEEAGKRVEEFVRVPVGFVFVGRVFDANFGELVVGQVVRVIVCILVDVGEPVLDLWVWFGAWDEVETRLSIPGFLGDIS
jgi:hypothetical protein